MLDDNELEELAMTSKSIYMDTTNKKEFVRAVQAIHHNVPPYIIRAQFIAIRAFDEA